MNQTRVGCYMLPCVVRRCYVLSLLAFLHSLLCCTVLLRNGELDADWMCGSKNSVMNLTQQTWA